MSSAPPPPALVLGRLADEKRMRAFAAVTLGASSVPDVASRAGLEVDLRVLAQAARASSTPRRRPVLEGATPEQEAVARNFVTEEGRLRALPARDAKRRNVLGWVANRFEPGREYAEKEVNGLLLGVYDDVASLRRYLVDEGFLTRQAGVYRRTSLPKD